MFVRVAQTVAQHDLLAVPVVDDQNRFQGIITADDALDNHPPAFLEEKLPRFYLLIWNIAPVSKMLSYSIHLKNKEMRNEFCLKNVLCQSQGVKFLHLLALIAGPGILVMVADNDAGGITTYTATGAKYGYGLIWFLVLLGPIAYFVQEMTVRLGAVTKRGHAEAIFDAFGTFWGWFSIFDLTPDRLADLGQRVYWDDGCAGNLWNSPLDNVVIVIILMAIMVIQGRYWTWEKIALTFCIINLIYIPAAFLVHPDWSQVLRQGWLPHFPGGLTGTMFFFLMANVGTTIAPWMVFFQQSAVVDKNVKEKDIPWSQLDTGIGAFFTVVVAIFCLVVTGGCAERHGY